MKIQPNKRFNKRHLFVIGIIALLVAAIQILPYTLIFNNKVETTNYEECVELPAKTECKNEKDFVAYTVNKEHTEISKITRDSIKTCYDYYTNPVYEERLPAVLALLSFLLLAAECLGGIVFVIWLIIQGFKWIYKLLEPSYEDDDEEDDNSEK